MSVGDWNPLEVALLAVAFALIIGCVGAWSYYTRKREPATPATVDIIPPQCPQHPGRPLALAGISQVRNGSWRWTTEQTWYCLADHE